MRNLLTFLFTMTVLLPLSGQLDDLEEYNNLRFRNQSVFNRLQYKDIEGHPFSNEEMISGTIVFVSGKKIEDVPLRYNWYTKEMQFKPDEEILVMPESLNIGHIEIGNERYIPFHYLKEVKGYLIEMHRGKCNLFCKKEVVFVDAKPAQSGYDEAQPANFKWGRNSYIVILNSGKLIKLDLHKKRLPRQFPEYEEQIMDYIKKNKINPKKEEDLLKLIDQIELWMN